MASLNMEVSTHRCHAPKSMSSVAMLHCGTQKVRYEPVWLCVAALAVLGPNFTFFNRVYSVPVVFF